MTATQHTISGGVVQEPERRHPPRPVPRVASERAAAPTGPDREPAASLGQLRQRLGTKVQLRYAQGKGALEIAFFSDGELERILEILGVRPN